MAKKIVGFIKLQIPAGKANPSPPIGPALGQRGLNIMEFCKAFNAQTQSMEPGLVLPVVITAFADKSFTFVLKTPPATVLIKKAAKLDKGSPRPHVDKVAKLTRAQAEHGSRYLLHRRMLCAQPQLTGPREKARRPYRIGAFGVDRVGSLVQRNRAGDVVEALSRLDIICALHFIFRVEVD